MSKKILYCENNVDGTVGGSYYSLFYLVNGLDKTKYHPIVIFYTDNILIPQFRNAGIETHIFKKPKSINFDFIWNGKTKALYLLMVILLPLQKIANLIRRLLFPAIGYACYLKRNGISLVHLNNSILYNHDWMLAARIAHVKCITHERGINTRFPIIAKYFGKNLDTVICISKAVKDNMIDRGNLSNLIVIHNGLDQSVIKVKIDGKQLLKRYRIDKEDSVIGIIGNIKEWKGQETVIRATALLKETHSKIKCFIIGDSSEQDRYYKKRLRSLVSKLNLSQNIIFTGFQKNVADYINIMDIVIHASILPEPFGRVLLEAMAMKKPVIGSRDGAVPEIIDNGKTGFTFTPGDAQELAHYLEILLSHQEKARRFGELGYIRLTNKFHILKNIESTQDLYQSILDNEN